MPDLQSEPAVNPIQLEPTNLEKLRGLPWSIAFNGANTVFVYFTFFGSAFVLFLNDLGLSKTDIGFLLSLLPVLGVLALWVGPRIVHIGYKRVFLLFFSGRTLFTAGLLLTPWFVARYPLPVVLAYVAVITIAFSLTRSIGLTAWLPWQQEYIPGHMRGKYSAYNNIVINLVGVLAVSAAGLIIGEAPALGRYMWLFALGVLFGALSIYFSASIPGGAPHPRQPEAPLTRQGTWLPLRDRNFSRFLAGLGFYTLATGPMFSFVPLYMQEKIGLQSGHIVLLGNGVLVGGLISSFMWGWMADRYGSKPVMLTGLLISLVLPLGWLVMPRQAEQGLIAAVVIALVQGAAGMGWGIGSGRMLYVNLIPPEKNASYTSLYYAWAGVVGGISQLFGGRALDTFRSLQAQVAGLEIDSYGILFLLGFLLLLVSVVPLRALRAKSEVSLGRFAGLFFHGNPLLAMESLIRFHFARNELATIHVTERLGRARSPLTVDELLDALSDPRFYVRFESIIAIAHHGPDARLITALVSVLQGNDPALSVIAAWALGRLGDDRALAALRESLDAPYRSVKAHAARSLASLGDQNVVTTLLERLESEPDPGLRVAYASALGRLQATAAAAPLLALLDIETRPETSNELALSLARLLDQETLYVHLTRAARLDPGTAVSQTLSGVVKRLQERHEVGGDYLACLRHSIESLARNDLLAGIENLACAIANLPEGPASPLSQEILLACARQFAQAPPVRLEYLLLATCALDSRSA